MARIVLEGTQGIINVLLKLPRSAQKTALIRSLMKGGRIIADKAKENLVANGSVDTGALLRSVGVFRDSKKQRVRGTGHVVVGFRKIKGSPSRRAHFVEFGTIYQPARPFMRPALDEKGPEAIDVIVKTLGGEIEREALKLVHQVGKRRSIKRKGIRGGKR